MSLVSHTGTAAIDLGKAKPAATKVTITHQQGMIVPNIAALDSTAADWVYSNGLYQPPRPIPWNASVFSTATNLPWGTLVSHPLTGFEVTPPPEPLPVEQREMPVVGYRGWKFKPTYKLGFGHRGALLPLNEAYGAWKKGINKATCKAGGRHRAGDQHCQCGFYVLADLDAAESWAGGMADDTVVGAVMGWGQVVQHGEEGWRAEYAKIIALLDCKFSKKQDANTKAAADSYGLEIYSRNALEAYVKEWGDPLPEAAVTP